MNSQSIGNIHELYFARVNCGYGPRRSTDNDRFRPTAGVDQASDRMSASLDKAAGHEKEQDDQAHDAPSGQRQSRQEGGQLDGDLRHGEEMSEDDGAGDDDHDHA